MRLALVPLLTVTFVQAGALPGWWNGLLRTQRLESDFTQVSESAVFGQLKRSGRLQVGGGGRLRVSYSGGLLVVSDGATLVQYDSSTRTAQRLNLHTAVKDMPLLNILIDPSALEASYTVLSEQPDQVLLKPKRKELPAVVVEGSGSFLRRIQWTDGTGAQQEIRLTQPRTPKAPFPASLFRFTAPAGTRWIG